MTKKKYRAKLAKRLRKDYGLDFAHAHKVAKGIVNGWFLSRPWDYGFSHEPKVISNAGHRDFGMVIGSLYATTKRIGGVHPNGMPWMGHKDIVIDSEDIKRMEYGGIA